MTDKYKLLQLWKRIGIGYSICLVILTIIILLLFFWFLTLFTKIDYNGNNIVSLAEIDKLVDLNFHFLIFKFFVLLFVDRWDLPVTWPQTLAHESLQACDWCWEVTISFNIFYWSNWSGLRVLLSKFFSTDSVFVRIISLLRSKGPGKHHEDFVHQKYFPLLLRSIFYFNRLIPSIYESRNSVLLDT